MATDPLKTCQTGFLQKSGIQEKLIYEHKIDQIFLWIEKLKNEQVTRLTADLIKKPQLVSKKFILTLLEPLVHRDYIYHKFDTQNESSFSSISTFISRELRTKHEKDVNKQVKRRKKVQHRIKSAYMTTQDDVVLWAEESVLPSIKILPSSPKKNNASYLRPPYPRQKHPIVKVKQMFEKPALTNTFDIWVNPKHENVATEVNLSLDSEDNTLSLPQINSSKTVSSHTHLFQCPARSTYLRRSKTQELPTIRTAPPKLQKYKNELNKNVDEGVFLKFPLSLKTKKRHLQTKDSTATRKLPGSFTNHMRKSKSLPLMLQTPESKQKENFGYELESFFLTFSIWTKKQQEDFLQTFLKLLSPNQIYFLYATLTVQLQHDFVHVLPAVISIQIFSYLKPKQLVTCSKVCKKWAELTLNDELWRKICVRKRINLHSIKIENSYRQLYLKHKKVKENWSNGKYTIHELHRHNGGVTSVQLNDNLIATCGTDKIIRVQKLKEKKCIAVLEGHQKLVWDVQFISSSLLCSSSSDHTLKIWNLRNSSCMRTIMAHHGPVWCILVKGSFLVSGSADKTAKLWDLRNCSFLHSFSGHSGGVYSLAMSDDKRKLFVGSIDQTVLVWDVITKICVATFQVGSAKAPNAPVTSLSYSKSYIACACGGEFRVIDAFTYNDILKVEQAHQDRIECLQLSILKSSSLHIRSDEKKEKEEYLKGRVITASKDGKIKVWNLQSFKPLYSIQLSTEGINSIKFDEVKVIAGLQDSTIKLINFV